MVATKERGADVWPVIQFSDIAAGTVSKQQLDLIHRRGCAVVRGQVPVETATAWDRSLVYYVDSNDFEKKYRGPAPDLFGTLAAYRPGDYPISLSA
ncbi:YbiU family protein, partial [Lacisediminihabitans profunda]|uniref:YbiU family protein n=1 Tax=Lacisediminihabitans profunda TaxID=2594790 RepID=UPI002482FE88